jgi:hypothetical protein
MATINNTDIIFATVQQQGNTILSMQLSGITSISQIIKQLREKLSDKMGLIKLHIRNRTQGWAQEQALYFQKPATPSVQLTLW